ncbi:MAG: DUF6261 family protein [Tannerellaceae bacterium]|jgi:hypothetical protein|nr:DUF6261 family protein [Tannerellaceae bacterium]
MLKIIYVPSFPARLRNAEHFDMYEHIVLHLAVKGLKPSAAVVAWNDFLLSFDKEDELYKRSAKQEETQQIKAVHEKRKTSYVVLRRIMELAAMSETPEVKEAGEALMHVMENYSKTYYAPMTEASALIFNLVQDMEKEKNAPKVALIHGAQDAIARLKRDNDAFMTLYAERTVNENDQKHDGRLVEARRQSDGKFGIVVDCVNALYYANEVSPNKDPEVSELLGDAIRFINSFLRKYEAIYSRRNPRYHLGKDDQPAGGDDETPGSTTPQLAISAQAVVGTITGMTGLGAQMSLQATDAVLFAGILYPEAKDGQMKIMNPETDTIETLPVADFLYDTDGTTPIGLLVDPPAANVFFEKPFYGFGGTRTAEIIKNDRTLAILTGLQYPATMIDN